MIGPPEIDAAATRIAAHVRRTPVLRIDGGELELVGRVVLKLESLQHTGSFKPRGAFNRVLSRDVPEAGLIAASGGNHGQAVAHAAAALGHRAEIFVPESAPAIKVERLRQLGAVVHLVGASYDDAAEACARRARESGALEVHPYDQPEIVAGAGTLARELQEQAPDIDTLLVAVGGGGLVAGVAGRYRDDARIVAVETLGCPTLHRALEAGRPVDVDVGGLAADSLGARRIGEIAFEAARRWVDDSLLVEDADLRRGQRLLWDRTRLVAEPGGATALAALVAGRYRPRPDEVVGIVLCGANTDPGSLSR